MLERWRETMTTRSAALLLTVEQRLDRILQVWMLFAGLACAARVAMAPRGVPIAGVSTWGSYMLLVLAPLASTLLALRWFADSQGMPQPATRLGRFGRWRDLPRAEAERHPLYGTNGLMVSLLIGIMLNVPVRAAEYLVAIPPLPAHSPAWFSAMHFAMTFDVVLFGSLYMIAFVAALRRVPLFPRLLVAIWIADLGMQLVTAKLVVGAGGLPAPVSLALHHVLEGNVRKVLISMALWLPYLILSTRVNVTFRNRVPKS